MPGKGERRGLVLMVQSFISNAKKVYIKDSGKEVGRFGR